MYMSMVPMQSLITSAVYSPGHHIQFSAMLAPIAVTVVVAFMGWAYKAIHPPAPKLCGTPGGPPITSRRIKLSDGRHLSYKEAGVPKEEAKYRIIIIHGHDSSKDVYLPASQEFIEELKIYFLLFDRAGYGESDPNPKRSIRSEACDIEELADKLQIGSKFYVLGMSVGAYPVYGCLRYIPHRLSGASLVVPLVHYWWPCLPPNLANDCFRSIGVQFQWAFRVAYYTPWLFHLWYTQKWFPSLSISRGDLPMFSRRDIQLLGQLSKELAVEKKKVRQQGIYESLVRDLIVSMGKWGFDPLDLNNPFPNNEGSVQIWQGGEDKLIPRAMNRFLAEKLPWIQYHEVPEGGHLIFHDKDILEDILRALFLESSLPPAGSSSPI